MLDAGRAPQQIGSLTVFFDHADENRRYVLPGAPKLVANPKPQLSLLLFRGGESGGLLQFEATLKPDDQELAFVERQLRESGRRPSLARPDWRSGSVSVAGWLQTTELAPKVLVTGAPSLVGDPLALIAARLDAAGAALADAALRGNALPTVVMFQLETLGLAGPLSVKAEADLRAIHDRLTAEGALTTPYGRARVAATWESMLREHLIRVTVVDENVEDPAGQRAEAMRRLGEDLLARMFSPFPPSEKPRQIDDQTVAPIELSFRLTMRREELETTARWDFRERRATTIRHTAAASLIDLLGTSPAADHIAFADTSAASRTLVVRAEPELKALGLAALEVDLRESADGPVDHSFVLTDGQPEMRVTARRDSRVLQYRVRTRFDPTLTTAPNRESPWMETAGSLAVVSARRLFPPRIITAIAGRVEFGWLEHVDVTIEPQDQPARSIVLSADRQSGEVFLAGAGSSPVMVTTAWRGKRDEPSRIDAPRPVQDDVLVLDSPFADSINVLAVPLPLPDVATIVVELRSRHGDFRHGRTVSWNAADRTPVHVGLRRLAGSPREFEYRVQLIRTNGAIEENPWRTATSPTLIVGADGPVDVRTVDVVLLGGGPAGRDSVAVELLFEAGEAHTSEVLEGTADEATLVLVVPKQTPASVLTAREYRTSGEVLETTWTDPQPLTVIAPIPVVTP